MRLLAATIVSTVTVLASTLALADPGQAQAALAAAAQMAPAPVQIAQAAIPAAPAPEAGAAGDPNEVVCRMTPPTTGSRLGGGRECHTQHEWDARQQEAQRALLKAQQVGYHSAGK